MNPKLLEALKNMQASGIRVGGRLVEESPDIEASYSVEKMISEETINGTELK